jgi:hypothetical protein
LTTLKEKFSGGEILPIVEECLEKQATISVNEKFEVILTCLGILDKILEAN